MRTWAIILIIAVLIAAPIAYWLISPAFIVKEANEPAPVFVPEPADTQTEEEPVESVVLPTRKDVAEEVETEEQPAQPTALSPPILAQGSLVEQAHEAEGAVLVYKGSPRVLRFEDYYTLNGPDLRIYLAADLEANDFVDLGPVKATKGSVNYDIPDNVDVGKYKYALIWCRAFSVLFAYAELV